MSIMSDNKRIAKELEEAIECMRNHCPHPLWDILDFCVKKTEIESNKLDFSADKKDD